MHIINSFSYSILILLVSPIVFFALSRSIEYIYLFITMLIVAVSVELIKPLFDAKWALRPHGAEKCGILMNGKNCTGAPGFPSGHVAVTTMVVICLTLMNKNKLYLWIIAVSWIIGMAVSRYYTNCHNIIQIIGGVVYGVIWALGFSYTISQH